jgi:translation elongation factor EF-Tu-like GTPase
MLKWLKGLLGIGRRPELFTATVESHFDIEGRGRIAISTVSAGSVMIGDTVFAHTSAGVFPVVVTGLELPGQLLRRASEGDSFGILLRGKMVHQIEQGDVISHSEEVD